MAELSREFKEEAWKEVQLSLDKLKELKTLSPMIAKLIADHESTVSGYLGHFVRRSDAEG